MSDQKFVPSWKRKQQRSENEVISKDRSHTFRVYKNEPNNTYIPKQVVPDMTDESEFPSLRGCPNGQPKSLDEPNNISYCDMLKNSIIKDEDNKPSISVDEKLHIMGDIHHQTITHKQKTKLSNQNMGSEIDRTVHQIVYVDDDQESSDDEL